MDLALHFSASINSVSSRQERKTGLQQGVFLLHYLFYQKKIILSIDQQNASSKFHSVFVSFILHLCIKLIANKLQPLPCKVSRKFSMGFGDYLIILVQHGASISRCSIILYYILQYFVVYYILQYILYFIKIDECVK